MARRASMQDLSPQLARAARDIAGPLRDAGKRAWIVGGAPRDLVLGRTPKEIDMASAATPDEIEHIFTKVVPLGRPFGTVLVRAAGLDVQHTTFRSESGYSDARRPDRVEFGTSVEADSSRRDFTCNALYLDPLDDGFLDPQGGFSDLESRRLRCVGDPVERFREDGLRLLRLARFAAALGLEPTPETMAAARASADALRGVSRERVLAELEAMTGRPGTARAFALLADLGLLEPAVPGAVWEKTGTLVRRLPDPPGLALGLAALLDPGVPDVERVLDGLRASRACKRRVLEILHVEAAIDRAPGATRAERVRLLRDPGFDEALALRRARGPAPAADVLEREKAALGETGLHPAPLVVAADLEAAAIPRGPAWSRILEEAETLQLDGQITSRADALAWLALRGQEGGKTPRNA
jgi:tRNA nucleotidyltransferase/poly(A) polymerase